MKVAAERGDSRRRRSLCAGRGGGAAEGWGDAKVLKNSTLGRPPNICTTPGLLQEKKKKLHSYLCLEESLRSEFTFTVTR